MGLVFVYKTRQVSLELVCVFGFLSHFIPDRAMITCMKQSLIEQQQNTF